MEPNGFRGFFQPYQPSEPGLLFESGLDNNSLALNDMNMYDDPRSRGSATSWDLHQQLVQRDNTLVFDEIPSGSSSLIPRSPLSIFSSPSASNNMIPSFQKPTARADTQTPWSLMDELATERFDEDICDSILPFKFAWPSHMSPLDGSSAQLTRDANVPMASSPPMPILLPGHSDADYDSWDPVIAELDRVDRARIQQARLNDSKPGAEDTAYGNTPEVGYHPQQIVPTLQGAGNGNNPITVKLYAHSMRQIEVRGLPAATTAVQQVVLGDALIVTIQVACTLLGALGISLMALQDRGIGPKVTAARDISGNDTSGYEALAELGVSAHDLPLAQQQVALSNAGSPAFQGDTNLGQHINFASGICQILSVHYGVDLQLSVTTEREGLPVDAQVFATSMTPTFTIGMHRRVTFEDDGTHDESWRPYVSQATQELLIAQNRRPRASLPPSSRTLPNIPKPMASNFMSSAPFSRQLLMPTMPTMPGISTAPSSTALAPVSVTTATPSNNGFNFSQPFIPRPPGEAPTMTAARPLSTRAIAMFTARAITRAALAEQAARATIAVPGRPPQPADPPGRVGYWRWMSKTGSYSWQSARMNHNPNAFIPDVEPRILKNLVELGDIDERDVSDEIVLLLNEGFTSEELGELFDQQGNAFYNARVKGALDARADAVHTTRAAILKTHQRTQNTKTRDRLWKSNEPPKGRSPHALYRVFGEYVDNAELEAEAAAYAAGKAPAELKVKDALMAYSCSRGVQQLSANNTTNTHSQGQSGSISLLPTADSNTISSTKRKRSANDKSTQAAQPAPKVHRSTRSKSKVHVVVTEDEHENEDEEDD